MVDGNFVLCLGGIVDKCVFRNNPAYLETRKISVNLSDLSAEPWRKDVVIADILLNIVEGSYCKDRREP